MNEPFDTDELADFFLTLVHHSDCTHIRFKHCCFKEIQFAHLPQFNVRKQLMQFSQRSDGS